MKDKSTDKGHEVPANHIPATTPESARTRAEEIAKRTGGKVIVSSSGDVHVVHVRHPAREASRAKLREAGVLATDLAIPSDNKSVPDEEVELLGAMRSGARPSEEIVAEDRGR